MGCGNSGCSNSTYDTGESFTQIGDLGHLGGWYWLRKMDIDGNWCSKWLISVPGHLLRSQLIQPLEVGIPSSWARVGCDAIMAMPHVPW